MEGGKEVERKREREREREREEEDGGRGGVNNTPSAKLIHLHFYSLQPTAYR
jgi:hypothetical protein